jgi:hypothetical protein
MTRARIMRALRVTVALTLFLLGPCTARHEPGDITVAELAAQPNNYEGKRVAVIGYYSWAMEESAMYNSTSAQPENAFAIWVSPGWRGSVYRAANRYVRAVGIFHHRPNNTSYPGELSDITFFRPLR